MLAILTRVHDHHKYTDRRVWLMLQRGIQCNSTQHKCEKKHHTYNVSHTFKSRWITFPECRYFMALNNWYIIYCLWMSFSILPRFITLCKSVSVVKYVLQITHNSHTTYAQCIINISIPKWQQHNDVRSCKSIQVLICVLSHLKTLINTWIL